MADKKTLDTQIAHQEKPSPENYSVSSKQGIQTNQDIETSTSVNFVESTVYESCSSLLQVRKALYEHIKAIPVDGSNFFMQQEKTYKRELVDIMRRIDKQEITTETALLELIDGMATQQRSQDFSNLLHEIKEILNSTDIELDNNLPPPPFP
jgi:hypothetical protein